MDTPAKAVGREIKRLRNERGWTQAELAAAAQVSVMTVSNAERGAKKTQWGNLEAMAKQLGVELPDLLRVAQSVAGSDPSRHTPSAQLPQPRTAAPAAEVLTPQERQLLEWFRGLDARKQDAALRMFRLFGELDATAVRHRETSPDHGGTSAGPGPARLSQSPVPVLRRTAR